MTDWARETRSNEEKVVILAADNSDTSIYLSDQNVAQFGTNRRSEILGTMGDVGKPFEETYNDYLDGL